jgi:DNA-binding response OmpR family regulator
MPYKVLIVDDDHATRVLLATVLGEAGYETITVSTLHTAMQALKDEAPDAVIVDVRLGGYNGLQLVVMNPRPIPVIVITGFSDALLEREARHMGAEYLLKPVQPSTLLTVLHQMLTSKSDGASQTAQRQWTRKQVTALVEAQVGSARARILDVSYGGLRLEIDRTPGAWLPLALVALALPTSDVPIPVNVVWKRPSGDASWLCGAAVPHAHQRRWRELVDAMS